jgi:uncharacterized membrane protein YjfL (UPF0719 family)
MFILPDWLVGSIVWLVQVVISIALGIGIIYIGINVLDRLVKEIDLQQELKKGNRAVAYLVMGMVIAIAIIVASGIGGLTAVLLGGFAISEPVEFFQAIAVGLAQLIGSLILSVVAIYIAITVWLRITKEIDEIEELKKRNQAVGLVMAGIMIAVAVVIQAGVAGLTGILG